MEPETLAAFGNSFESRWVDGIGFVSHFHALQSESPDAARAFLPVFCSHTGKNAGATELFAYVSYSNKGGY